jgi:hypothetical protein
MVGSHLADRLAQGKPGELWLLSFSLASHGQSSLIFLIPSIPGSGPSFFLLCHWRLHAAESLLQMLQPLDEKGRFRDVTFWEQDGRRVAGPGSCLLSGRCLSPVIVDHTRE